MSAVQGVGPATAADISRETDAQRARRADLEAKAGRLGALIREQQNELGIAVAEGRPEPAVRKPRAGLEEMRL